MFTLLRVLAGPRVLKGLILFLVIVPVFFSQTAGASLLDIIAKEISITGYRSYVEDLESFGTRYYNTSGNTAAQDYISRELSSFGLEVALEDFSYYGTQYNVVATLPGTITPEEVYIVGAHYDSTSNNPQISAPGADDNASGVAAVLEMARVLAKYVFRSTIKFILFDAEEKGMKGSWAYADDAFNRGEDIRAMINFDMIAYTGGNPNEDVEVYGETWLRDIMIESIATYTTLFYEAHAPLSYGSDHVPFSSTNYPGSSSLLIIENSAEEIWGGSNPYYHKTTDTSDHLDWGFASAITVAGAATLAVLARPLPVPALAANFGLLGLYAYAGETWLKLSSVSPEDMVGVGADLYADLGEKGFWKYDGWSWERLSRSNAETMGANETGVFVYFDALGLYRYDGTWKRLSKGKVENMFTAGSDLYVDFGTTGFWKYDGEWKKLSRLDARNACVVGDAVYVDFPGIGLWRYDESWELVSDLQPEDMLSSGVDLLADFGDAGLWMHDGFSWSLLSKSDAEDMVAEDGNVYVNFGEGIGLYKHDGVKWARINKLSPEKILAFGGKLFADFGGRNTGGYGLYKYDDTWSRISSGDAEQLCTLYLQ